ncbi:MAG: porin [Alphaproteobacteria bacterium]|nr:MAG: porin [Alphaproteobacteria bacterium]
MVPAVLVFVSFVSLERRSKMRKELLYGTTALLVGAVALPGYASAEEPLRLQVRGFKNEFFAIGGVDVDTDPTLDGTTSNFSDGEVQFRGSTTLDNGLTVGVQIELEAFGATSDDIDEAYTYVQGDFGKLVIGSENLAEYTTFWGVTAPGVGIPINSGWITAFAVAPTGINLGFRRTGLTTNATLTNDTFQISYLSPRFSGFQFVAGYAPTNALGSGDPKSGVTDDSSDSTEVTDIFGVGLNFKQSFNGVDVAVAGGYEHGSEPNGNVSGDDPQIVKVGASVGFAGFTIAGSYVNQLDGLQNAGGTTSTEGQAWDAGASYSTGPWGVSVTYFHGEEEDLTANTNEDEVDSVVGAVSYALGPGITTSFSLFYAKYEDETGVESDATYGILGLSVSF